MPASRQMTDTTDGPHAIFWPVHDVRFVPKADIGSLAIFALFDYLVCNRKHARRNCKTECFCSFEVDDQFKFSGCLHRQGLLVDPTNPNAEFETADMQAAVDVLGYKLVVARASTGSEVDTAFTNLVERRIDALAVAAHAFFLGDSHQLAALALDHRLAAIYAFREDALAGGLISYGGSLTEAYHQAGIYTGRVLKGDKPADLLRFCPSGI
jgi:hypothetical protein